VLNRQKDIQYSSRAITHISRQKQLLRLRLVVSELVKQMPEQLRGTPEVQELAGYGCLTRMHVVRLLASLRRRWDAGYADTQRVLSIAPWEGEFNPIEGFILHEARTGTEVKSS
jgi:NTE family protein